MNTRSRPPRIRAAERPGDATCHATSTPSHPHSDRGSRSNVVSRVRQRFEERSTVARMARDYVDEVYQRMIRTTIFPRSLRTRPPAGTRRPREHAARAPERTRGVPFQSATTLSCTEITCKLRILIMRTFMPRTHGARRSTSTAGTKPRKIRVLLDARPFVREIWWSAIGGNGDALGWWARSERSRPAVSYEFRAISQRLHVLEEAERASFRHNGHQRLYRLHPQQLQDVVYGIDEFAAFFVQRLDVLGDDLDRKHGKHKPSPSLRAALMCVTSKSP